MHLENLPNLVVGAGLWGCVLAERIATVLGERVLVIDRRDHTGGNCHSFLEEETGIECHAYGTHIFHTSIERVWEYITQFSRFTQYKHTVLTEYRGRVYQMPIGLATINDFYGIRLHPYEVAAFIKKEAGKEAGGPANNLEEKAVSLIGRPLYEAFIKGYTQKQWGRDPRELPPEIITRLPVRTNYSGEYFTDPWQGLPEQGYAALFSRLLAHPRITVKTGVAYEDIAFSVPQTCRVFYSGPLDALFAFSHGALEWRSLRFEARTEPYADWQGTAVMNQADVAVPYTRTHEYKHLHPERAHKVNKTVLVREYPKTFERGDEPYYPVNTPANDHLQKRYVAMLEKRAAFIAGGRLGSYQYMDMDKTIESALSVFDTLQVNAAARA